MRFTNIELELQPMTGLAMIENALTPANDGVRAGLRELGPHLPVPGDPAL